MSKIKHKNIHNNSGNNIAKIGWQFFLDDNTFGFGYINSYYEAANKLVEKSTNPDLDVFPIFFCYRQYLELLLKNICFNELNENDYISFINCTSHNLKKIWEKTREILSCLKEKDLDKIEKVIKDFSELDNFSFNFRYPTDKRLNCSLKEKITKNSDGSMKCLCINLDYLKHNMGLVDGLLRFTYDE